MLPGRGARRDKANAAARHTLGQLLLNHLGKEEGGRRKEGKDGEG